MTTYKEKILAQFEPDIAAKLLEFAETISKQDSDVFLFMSRKFCCLYDLLLSIGAPPVQKPIVSDKVLDLETDFFRGKVVTIVDDIIICGTTIWKAKERLLKYYGAKEVRTSVFCVNEKYWVKECIEPEYKAAVLSEERSLTFCSSIVNSLSIAPRPYAVEFPYFTETEIKTPYWHQILSSRDWNVYDITSKLQEDNDVSTLTFSPSVTILDEMKKAFGKCILELIDIAKVRVYTKKMTRGIKMSILPIITFKALRKESIKEIFDNLFSVLNDVGFDENIIDRFKVEFTNPISQLRFIQYTSALILANKFKYNLQRALDKPVNIDLRDLDIELLFGSWNLPSIKTLAKIYLDKEEQLFLNIIGIEPAILDLESTELKTLMENPNNDSVYKTLDEDEKFPEDDPRNIFSDFSNIFLSLYHKKEIPSRVAVKEAAPKKDWESIRKIDRLETGITWIGILEYLKNIFHYTLTPEVKNVLSLVLDYSVDKGICVPVIRHNTDTDIVFRAFRHGEDVKFAEEETELCGFAIENAQEVIGKGQLPKLFVEKLLVLLIRIGASRNILQVQYGTNGQEGIAKIGFYLQGAVVKLKKRNSYNAESNIWLSRHLLEKGVIKKPGKGMYAFGKHYPAIQVTSSSRTEAQKFGYILGLLYKGVEMDGKNLRIDDDDLVFLSTCFRPRDVAAALLVELDLYIEEFYPLIQKANDDLDKKRLNKLVTYNNILTNIGYFALNSLHKKTEGWSENGAVTAIEKGKLILDKLNQSIAKFDWEAYWSSLEILKREDEEKVFNDFIFKMSEIGHRLLFNANLLEIVLSFNKWNPVFSKNRELKQSVEKLDRFFERSIRIKEGLFSENEIKLIVNLKKQVESDFADFDEQKTLSYINKKFIELNYELSKLTPLVSSILDEFEQRGDATIQYDYVLYYDIVDSTATKKMKTYKEVETYRNAVRRAKVGINDFVSFMQKRAREEKDEVYCWNGDASSTNDAKYVFFSSVKAGFSLRRVKEFIDRLYNFSTSEISFRAVVCPANAFYSKLFKRFQRTEVEGEQFWEHHSRVLKKFKELEIKYEANKNLVLVIGNESTPVPSDKLSLKQNIWSGQIETVIAAGYFKTYGELWIPK
jgi:hypoxanthine phosphoribosyltransferase